MKKAFPLLLILPFFFSACTSKNSADLNILYLKDGVKKEATYTCSGRGCDPLKNILWQPVPTGRICPEGWSGTDLIRIKGQVNGEKRKAQFNRTNGCEIRRFDSLDALLQQTNLRARQETPAALLQFSQVSQKMSFAFPYLTISLINTLLLFLLFIGMSIWIWALVGVGMKKNWDIFFPSLFFPPLAIIWMIKEKMARPSIRILLDGAIVTTFLFLPFWLFPPMFLSVVFLEIFFSSKEKKEGKIGEESEKE